MALNFTFALVSWRKLSANYLHNFVFSVHLNFGYFSAANFWRKSFCCRQRSFSVSVEKKPKIICLFSSSLDVNYGKIRKPNFRANFSKIYSLKHHKKNARKVRVVKPFKKVQLKKNENCLPPTQAISDEKS
jgi:hypothetical protein